jgi:hypothetical protein
MPEQLPPCQDCAAEPGMTHEPGCDTARCMHTGRQRLACPRTGHDCGEDIWTGEWPGVAECREFGWYGHWADERLSGPWTRCAPGHPAATEDLNRLASEMEARWDRKRQRWVLR